MNRNEMLQDLISALQDEHALGHATEALDAIKTAETVETLSDFEINVGDALDSAKELVRALESITRQYAKTRRPNP